MPLAGRFFELSRRRLPEDARGKGRQDSWRHSSSLNAAIGQDPGRGEYSGHALGSSGSAKAEQSLQDVLML